MATSEIHRVLSDCKEEAEAQLWVYCAVHKSILSASEAPFILGLSRHNAIKLLVLRIKLLVKVGRQYVAL